MKESLGGFVVVLTLLLAPSIAAAQMTVGPTVAWHDDADFGVGVTVGGAADAIVQGGGYLGNFTWFFPGSGVTYYEINADLTFDIALESSNVFPFLLAGLGLAHSGVDTGPSETKLGANIGAGLDFDFDRFRPSVAAKFEIGGGKGFSVFATLPFQSGGS